MRLIDADKLEVISYKETEGREDTFDAGVQWMAELIDKQPTVEAVPVVHGKWIKMNSSRLTLLQCTTAASVISQSSRSTLHFRRAANTVER